MAMPLTSTRHRSRTGGRLLIALVAVALVGAVAWMAVSIGNPLPATRLVMATGPEGSGYREFGLRYQEILRRAGVELVLVPTSGGVENLARLRDPASGVAVAFVESGVTNRKDSPGLFSLGAVALEPLWLFSRGLPKGTLANRLRGKRISIEPEGSGTRLLSSRLLALNGLSDTSVTLLGLKPDQSAEALIRGEIDVAVMLTSYQSPAVQRLLSADGVVLEGFARADALVARFPNLSKVILPTGVADLARNIPPADVQLLAAETNLLTRRDLHPALQYLLLEAAAEVHGGPDVFYRAGRFPGPGSIDLPLSDQAQTFYKSGRPFVYRYLPFWMAALTEKLLILLIPLFAVVFPLASILPRLFAWVTERRIFALYKELKLVERELELPEGDAELDRLEEVLADLDRRANHFWVPFQYAQRLFFLKSHVALAREQVEKRRGAAVRPTT
ncbi:MAG TPA: TAXI family TRAP transporter solute-binding subunit [Gemmatimonadales bacterium]|jgi:TRAP-type uncharacterized transport system substrate-binding protein